MSSRDPLITLTNNLGRKNIINKELYEKEPDSIQTLRKIIRELQNDDPFNKCRQKLFEIGILKHDLIKIVEQYCDKLDIPDYQDENGRTTEDHKKEFNVVLRILLNLSQPTEECFRKSNEEEEGGDRNPEVIKAKRDCEIALREAKKAFISVQFWSVYQKRLYQIIETEQNWIEDEEDKENRRDKKKDRDFDPENANNDSDNDDLNNTASTLSDDDDPYAYEDKQKEIRDRQLEFERMLMFLKNVLAINPPASDQNICDGTETTHDKLIATLYECQILKILVFLMQQDNFTQWALHILEIICLVFKHQDAKVLAKTNDDIEVAKNDDMVKKVDELSLLLENERRKKNENLRKGATRHSRFGGTFIIKAVDSQANTGDPFQNEMVVSRQAAKLNNLKTSMISTDDLKTIRKVGTKRPLTSRTLEDLHRYSSLKIRLILKQLAIQLIENSYNQFLNTAQVLVKNDAAETPDQETLFFIAADFFPKFAMEYGMDISTVSETINIDMVHLINRQLIKTMEGMQGDKANQKLWARRCNSIVKCYYSFLQILINPRKFNVADEKSEHFEKILNIISSIKSNVMYVQEYRDIIPTLIRLFNSNFAPTDLLNNLVLTADIFIKMVTEFSTEKGGKILVKAKDKKKRGKNKNPMDLPEKPLTFVDSDEQRKQAWEQSRDKLLNDPYEKLGFRVLPHSKDNDDRVNQTKTVLKIQIALHNRRVHYAWEMLKKSRDFWPECEDRFGNRDFTIDDDLGLLSEICLTDLEEQHATYKVSLRDGGDDVQNDKNGENEENAGNDENSENPTKSGSDPIKSGVINTNIDEASDEEYESANDSQEEMVAGAESVISVNDYVVKFAQYEMVKQYGSLLARFDTNSPKINHCLVKMLYRVSHEAKRPSLLFQATLLRTFQKILQSAKHKKELKTSAQFAIYILRKFFNTINTTKNKLMPLEILFWKCSATTMHDIETGKYGAGQELYALGNKSVAKWSDAEVDQLEKVFNETERNNDVDWVAAIIAKLDNDEFTRRQVQNQMLKMGLCSRDDLQSIKKKEMFVWKDSYVNELKTLFEEFNGKSEKVIEDIRANMSIKPLPSKNKIIAKMIEMNLMPDRSAIRKSGKSGKSGNLEVNPLNIKSKQFVSESESDSDDMEFGNIPGLPALEFKVLENGENCSENLVKFLITELKTAEEEKDEDDSEYEYVILPENGEVGTEMKSSDVFLKSLGLRPPGDQHTTWKVPAKLNVKRVLKMLEKVVERRGESGKKDKDSGKNDGSDELSDSEEVLMTEHPKKVKRAKKVTIFSDSDDSDSENENDDQSSKNSSKNNSKNNSKNSSQNSSINNSKNSSDQSIQNPASEQNTEPKSEQNPASQPISTETETEVLVTELAKKSEIAKPNNLDSIDSELSEDEMVMHSDKSESEEDEMTQPTKKMKISKVTFSSDSE